MASALTLGAATVPSLADVGASSHQGDEITGHSTLERTICPNTTLCPTEGFTHLRTGPGERHVVREDLAPAKRGRQDRRRSLAYLAQLTDFQLSDEESPARVEFLDDDPSGTASSAQRPQETLIAHEVDRTIRQLNRFLRSPVRQGSGERAKLLNAVLTGDQADNQQFNETRWVVQLLEGGVFQKGRKISSNLDPSSGTSDRNGLGCPRLGKYTDSRNPRRYTGVQDYDDYPLINRGNKNFYDPDEPERYDSGDWPRYFGLLDRAQQPFRVEGLKVPSYVAFGNHDNLVQGNEDANKAYEDVATGCIKPLVGDASGSVPGDLADGLPAFSDLLSPNRLIGLSAGEKMIVPRDERRRFVDKVQAKRLHNTGKQPDQHGFAHIDDRERRASRGAASYYDFSPKRGLRYIVLDTVSEGGVTPESSDGNIDDPQFRWLRGVLRRASERNELITVFGHHAASSSLTSDVPDEVAPPCTARDEHNHDVNPGCDRDPRPSTPLHDGDDLTQLFHRHSNVIAYVAGHSHEGRIEPFKREGGGGFWEIKSPAVVEWPPQHRLLEVMNNRDGTLSVFGTLLDFAAPVRAPDSGALARNFDARTLASVGRTLTYNDPQQGPDGSQGAREDRNVELLLRDPRGPNGPDDLGDRPACTKRGTSGNDIIRGTSGDDVICAGGGNDVVYGLGGDDRVYGGSGNDVLRGGAGADRLFGEDGNDDVIGGAGDDRLSGGRGKDVISGQDGGDYLHTRDSVRGNDIANGGPGGDSCDTDLGDTRSSC